MWFPARALSLTLLSLLAAPTTAQLPPVDPELTPCLGYAPDNTIVWPATGYGTPTDLRRVVIANLDGDESPDAVVNAGGTAVVLWDVAFGDVPEAIVFPPPTLPPSAIADLAVMPGFGDGGRDALLMTDSRGLFLVKHDGQSFQASVIDSLAWVNAAPIHVDSFDNTSHRDAYGIASDQKTILTIHCWSPTSFVPGLAVIQSFVLRDLVAMNWNTDTPRELVALANGRGLRIYNTGGTMIATSQHTIVGPACITRLFDGGTEFIAWIRTKSTGATELLVLRQGSLPSGQELQFNACNASFTVVPIALVAGDYDADDDEDLFIVHETNLTGIALENKAGSARFDPSDPAHFDIVPLAAYPDYPGVVGIPAFAQVDDEGEFETLDLTTVNPVDLIVPVGGTARVEVFTSLPDQRDRLLPGASLPPNSADIFNAWTEFNPDMGDPPAGRLVIKFNRPSRYATCDEVRLAVWQEDVPAAEISPMTVKYESFPLVGAQEWIQCGFPFPEDECWGDTSDEAPCFYVELRFFEEDGTASRIFPAGFRLQSCADNETSNYPYIVQQGIPGKSFQLRSDQPGGPSLGPGKLLGIFVPMSSNPPFQGGSAPDRVDLWYSELFGSF